MPLNEARYIEKGTYRPKPILPLPQNESMKDFLSELYRDKHPRWAQKTHDVYLPPISTESAKLRLWDIFEQAGSPYIKLYEPGTASYPGEDINRASYSMVDSEGWGRKHLDPDTMRIFLNDLLSDFMAEAAHGVQYKEKYPKGKIRDKREKERRWERERYGEEVYGWEDALGGKWFPTEQYFDVVDDESGKKVVMSRGKVTDRDVPKKKVISVDEHGETTTQTLGWSERIWDLYDELTGLGKMSGDKPTFEFEAHDIIEPMLWDFFSHGSESLYYRDSERKIGEGPRY